MISAGQASAWPKFAHILGHDEWIDIPEFQRVEDRVKNRVLLAPMIAEETSKFEKNVLLERLAEAKIAAAPVMMQGAVQRRVLPMAILLPKAP